jgi:hypothetical protein
MLIKYNNSEDALQISVTENVRILQLAEGSLPISNPAWLSADGPVVSDPASAKGISVAESVLRPI